MISLVNSLIQSLIIYLKSMAKKKRHGDKTNYQCDKKYEMDKGGVDVEFEG